MNFYMKLANGYASGVTPNVKLEDGWHQGEELSIKTPDGWRTVWRREVVFINLQDRAQASIFELMGSPTKRRHYTFINRATLFGGTSGFALRTGVFPPGSTLTIINEGAIRGAGGKGAYPPAATPGLGALLLDFDATLDNRAGYIFGGGGGGGYSYAVSGSYYAYAGGGGGAGRPGGANGSMFQTTVWGYSIPGSGTDAAGGLGGRYTSGVAGGAGGGPGAPGVASTTAAGAAGYAIDRAGHILLRLDAVDNQRLKGAIV